MKHAILTSKTDAEKLQADDDAAARMPWPGVYLDGTPAPAGMGVTLHRYDVAKHPSKEEYAYPVEDDAKSKGKAGDPITKANLVDKLPADWEAKSVEPKTDPFEDEKPTKVETKGK